ncbi:MAG: heavy-metal-associated domain-containing protein [Gemmatimonadaceae bacterium]|nr:heavy-metal-associated domain-containing protein [Gemmatimonadaceae bacterium]
MTKLNLAIDGMSCGHCVNAVRKSLASVPGAVPLKIDVGSAEVEIDTAVTSADAVLGAINGAGYRAQLVAT